jgi:uncharacterized membrane protein
MLWLGVIAKTLYNDSIGFLLRKSNETFSPNWPAAVLVYFIIAIGILYFALPKAGNSYIMGLLGGAMLGLVVYGVYDFTNYSLIANWPLKITLIDFIWGMVLCGLTTCFAVFMQHRISS